VEAIVKLGLGPTGLMQFGEFDDGRFIRKQSGAGTPRSLRLLIANPLMMKQISDFIATISAASLK
jgi:hypothetical protein